MFDISVYKLLKGNDGGKIDHLDWQNPMHLSSNYKENVNMRSIASLSALPRQLLYGGCWGWVGVGGWGGVDGWWMGRTELMDG